MLVPQTYDITSTSLKTLTKELAEIEGVAAEKGYVLAKGHLFAVQAATPAVDPRVQYVRALLQLRNLDNMRGNAASYVAALDVAGARGVVAQSLDAGYRARLEGTARRLQAQLRLAAPWTEAHPEFQVCRSRCSHLTPTTCMNLMLITTFILQLYLGQLRDVEIYNIQLQVEREVSNIAALGERREQEGRAGKNTRNLQYRLTAAKKRILDLMSAWTALHALGNEHAVLPAFDEADVLSNVLPWQHASSSKGPVTHQQMQLQLYQVESELARDGEELDFLPHDAMRCVLRYQRQIAMMQAWLMQHGSIIHASNVGRLMLVCNALNRLEAIQADAVSLFISCGWMSECAL